MFRLPDESSAYGSCVGTHVSGMHLTCPIQFSCDLTMCVSVTATVSQCQLCLFEDASVGYPILPLHTNDRCGYALLELLERVHMATLGDPCLTAIQEGGRNNFILVDGRPVSWLLFWSLFLRRHGLSSCHKQSMRISYIASLHRYLPTLGNTTLSPMVIRYMAQITIIY